MLDLGCRNAAESSVTIIVYTVCGAHGLTTVRRWKFSESAGKSMETTGGQIQRMPECYMSVLKKMAKAIIIGTSTNI